MFCFVNQKYTDLVTEIQTIDGLEIFTIDFTDDIFTDLSYIGLKLEKLLLDRQLLWNNRPVPGTLISWNKLDTSMLSLLDITKDIRGDEIYFPNRNIINYTIGHPRAIVKWCASMSKVKDISQLRSFKSDEQYKKIVWWASRLNLRIYNL